MNASSLPEKRRPSKNRPRGFDVLGLGCVAVDELLYVRDWPEPDAKTPVARRERHCGGLTATALVAAARLGARCAYAGVLGRDPQSDFVLAALERAGVDVRPTLRKAGALPVQSVIVVDERAGTRNIFYTVKDVIGAAPQHPSARIIRSSRVLFVDRFGMAGMIRAARIARAAGVPVVADLESTDAPRFTELFRLADHLIVSEEFALHHTRARHPASAVALLMSPHRKVVVVTCGVRGCWFQEAGWRLPSFHRAFPVKVVDTTGCGDVFHGAYAAALARGLPLVERIRLASATAALKAMRPGGQSGIPTLKQVRELLRRA